MTDEDRRIRSGNINSKTFFLTKSLFWPSILAFIFSFLSFSARAENLIIGVEKIDYFPYYQTVNKEYIGFSRELLDKFGEKHGYSMVYKPLPITRLYESMLTGKIDFKYPDRPNWGGKEKGNAEVFYSNAIVGYVDGVLVSKENESLVFDDLASIGFVRGFSPWVFMEHIDSGNLKAREVNSLKSLMLLTIDGRIKGAYFNIEVGKHLLESELSKPNALVFAEGLPHDKSNYMMSTSKKERMKVIEQFNLFLKSDEALEVYKKFKLDVF